MPKIRFQHEDGSTDTVDAAPGTSIMRAALGSGVSGIVGECGGQAMCATCHVYVHPDYLGQLPPVSEDEDEMLECTVMPRDHVRSRLGCQIALTQDLDGILVDIPARQV